MNSDASRGEAATKPTPAEEPRLKKFITQQLDKASESFWTWVISGLAIVLVWGWHRISVFLSPLGTRGVPLWLFSLLLTPGVFGLIVFVRWLVHRRTPSMYVTLDPQGCFCQDTLHGTTPALLVYFRATFANGGQDEQLWMYAYPRGTKSLSHFYEPISLPPGTATLDVDVQFFCTRPPGRLKDPYSATFVFVDAGGHKHRQRLSLKLQPKAVIVAAKPASTTHDKSGDLAGPE